MFQYRSCLLSNCGVYKNNVHLVSVGSKWLVRCWVLLLDLKQNLPEKYKSSCPKQNLPEKYKSTYTGREYMGAKYTCTRESRNMI